MVAYLLGVEVCYESYESDKKVLATKIIKEVDETLLSKVLKVFIKEKFIILNCIEYFMVGNIYLKSITDLNEKLKLILEAHQIGHEGYCKTYQ